MYAIVHNNFVILTQPNWNTRMFTNILAEECNVERRILLADEQNVPIILNENTKILKVSVTTPEYNPKIEWLDGPIFDIQENIVNANYTVKPLDLIIAKGNLISKLPSIRYEKEKKNIDIQITYTYDNR